MTCYQVHGAVVCRPDVAYRRRILWCPVCECTREMVVAYYRWYDTTVMCCGCGDAWAGGALLPRPFARSWRHRAVLRYRRLYAEATFGLPPRLAFRLAETVAVAGDLL